MSTLNSHISAQQRVVLLPTMRLRVAAVLLLAGLLSAAADVQVATRTSISPPRCNDTTSCAFVCSASYVLNGTAVKSASTNASCACAAGTFQTGMTTGMAGMAMSVSFAGDSVTSASVSGCTFNVVTLDVNNLQCSNTYSLAPCGGAPSSGAPGRGLRGAVAAGVVIASAWLLALV